MNKNPLVDLKALGQSVWLGYLRRNTLDNGIDPLLKKLQLEKSAVAETGTTLHGQVAIASAKVAYQINQEIFGGERFQKLARMGARSQRLLWASTGTKNPEYSDVKYIETLIGRETIKTIPPETLNAYQDHGKPSSQLEKGIQEAYHVLDGLRQVGIDLDVLTQQLEDDGVAKFNKAFEHLMAALQIKRAASSQEAVNP